MIPVIGVGEIGIWRINQALYLLRCYAPSHYQHFLHVIRGIVFNPNACDDGIACTGDVYGQNVVLTRYPGTEDLIELAVTLSHEARHYRIGPLGEVYGVPHNCTGCTNPYQRALDLIYREDGRLRMHLLRNVALADVG